MKNQPKEYFFILHSNYKKDLCVSIFSTKETAEKIVMNEVRFIEQSLMYQGKKPETVVYPSGNANLYVPDTDIFHGWQILEGFFYCREDTQDPDLIPNKFGFVTKECFVVLDYSYNGGTRVYAFDTRAAANECIVKSTFNMEDILRMNKSEPEKHIVPGVSSCLTVPNTSIRYEWTIIESAISIQMMANQVHMVTEMCPNCETEVTLSWDTETMGFKAFCPNCGEVLMLCSECRCSSGVCDFDEEGNFCKHNITGRTVPSSLGLNTPKGLIVAHIEEDDDEPNMVVALRRPGTMRDLPLARIGYIPGSLGGVSVLTCGDGKKSKLNERVFFEDAEKFFQENKRK